MRVRVIDTIQLSSSSTYRYPDIEARGDGVMAVLDSAEIQVSPDVQGKTIMITRPDGSVTQFLASIVEVHHGTVAIFFSGAFLNDVPRGSELEF